VSVLYVDSLIIPVALSHPGCRPRPRHAVPWRLRMKSGHITETHSSGNAPGQSRRALSASPCPPCRVRRTLPAVPCPTMRWPARSIFCRPLCHPPLARLRLHVGSSPISTDPLLTRTRCLGGGAQQRAGCRFVSCMRLLSQASFCAYLQLTRAKHANPARMPVRGLPRWSRSNRVGHRTLQVLGFNFSGMGGRRRHG